MEDRAEVDHPDKKAGAFSTGPAVGWHREPAKEGEGREVWKEKEENFGSKKKAVKRTGKRGEGYFPQF